MMLLKHQKMVYTILQLLFPSIPKDEIQDHVSVICRLIETRGSKHGLEYLSATEDYLMNLTLETSGKRKKQGIRMKTHKDGFPK